MDATSTIEQLKSGNTSAEKLLTETLTKLASENPKLNAATEILKEEAQQQIKNLTEGPLKGLPISIKECYGMAGKKITSGSTRMKPIDCHEDATVVKKLKAAGAIVVARGNTSEFLLGRETDNLVHGTTNNAINPSLTAGGSSGGDASLVGSGLVAFGIGTDIGGSCRYPAVFNGIVGFKPASGQIDKKGIFPSAGNDFTESMNSPGILCRSVRDARKVYNLIGNKTLNANADVSQAQIFTSTSFRVAIRDDSIKQAMTQAVDIFKTKNLSIKDLEIPESGELYYPLFATLMCAGFTDKIYEWSTTTSGEKLSYLGELYRRITGKQTISDELFGMLIPFNIAKPSPSKLKKTIERVESLRKKYYSILAQNGILILPTVGLLAPLHKKLYPQYNKPGVVEIITPVSFCNILNLSCITLPAWKFQKNKEVNPPAVQLITAPGNEELLLNVAEMLEAQLK